VKKVANDLSFNDIKIGDYFYFNKIISKKDVLKFAELTGDYNPLHVDENYASTSIFKINIIHGMFCASLFSTLVGMYCPGKRCLYLSQNLNFRKPAFYNDILKISGEVIDKNISINTIKMKLKINRNDEIIVIGEAVLKII
jgi:acyl dehydratase